MPENNTPEQNNKSSSENNKNTDINNNDEKKEIKTPDSNLQAKLNKSQSVNIAWANSKKNSNIPNERSVSLPLINKNDETTKITRKTPQDTRFGKYFFHPIFRMFIVILITFLNFLILAEDPVAHSQSVANIPALGNTVCFFIRFWDSTLAASVGLYSLRIVFVIISLLSGLICGKYLIHNLILRRILKVGMFQKDKGSWMCMFIISLIIIFIGSSIYNSFIPLFVDDLDLQKKITITGDLGITNEIFMRIAATGTWFGDCITALMVFDMILQDKSRYKTFAVSLRNWYSSWKRLLTFWILFLLLSFISVTAILTSFFTWENYNINYKSNELSRGILAGFITAFDLMIVMQDWEFPLFATNQDINLPGLTIPEVDWTLFNHMKIEITGKWFNYGIIFCVMLLDFNMLKNQVLYIPHNFAQYTDPNHHIWTVRDPTTLQQIQTLMNNKPVIIGNDTITSISSILSWEARGGSLSGDEFQSSMFIGAISFFLLMYLYNNRNPDKEKLIELKDEKVELLEVKTVDEKKEIKVIQDEIKEKDNKE